MSVQLSDGDVVPFTDHHMRSLYTHFGTEFHKCSQCGERYPESGMFYCRCKKWCCKSAVVTVVTVDSKTTLEVCPDCAAELAPKCNLCEEHTLLKDGRTVKTQHGVDVFMCVGCIEYAAVLAEEAMEGMSNAA